MPTFVFIKLYAGDTSRDSELNRKAPVPNTQSREVNLTKRVQTSKGMRYCPLVLSANGRVKPDLVLVNGRPERHSDGAYYLEWREKGRRVRLSVGKDPQDAAARRQRKEAELNALNQGVTVVPENGDGGHRSVATAVTQYLEETELTKKPKTLAAYTTALNYFTESCPKLYLQDIERADLLKFCAFLRDKKRQAPRSCWNKFANVMSFLKANSRSWPCKQLRSAIRKKSRRCTSQMNSTSSSRPATPGSGSGTSSF